MATAYTNFGGKGWRVGYFQISTNLTGSTNDMRRLVDGITGSSAWYAGNQTASGKWILFKWYGSRRVIDAFKIYKGSGSPTASFKFQGYDGSSWTDLTTFSWPTASGATEFTFTNTTAYFAYRFLGVSGNWTNDDIYEIEFSTQANGSYETGNRGALVTASASGISSGGSTTPQNLFDGDDGQNTTHSWYPTNNQNVAGAVLKFALAAAQEFVGLQIKSYYTGSTPGSNGFWKVQGSNDDSAWTDLTDAFEWTFGFATTYGPIFSKNVGSYAYYRLLGVSGLSSSTPWYTEIEFDAGVIDWDATALVYQSHASVLSQGPGSVAKVYQLHASVLLSLTPAGELKGDTNAGVYNDVDAFGGSDSESGSGEPPSSGGGSPSSGGGSPSSGSGSFASGSGSSGTGTGRIGPPYMNVIVL